MTDHTGNDAEVRESHPTIDRLLEEWRPNLGKDFVAYRNHVYRVFNIAAAALRAQATDIEKLAVAAAFHDAAIWLDGTFDYLEPSVHRAVAYLQAEDRLGWVQDVANMIRQHHKITPWRGEGDALVEAFRKADWLDVCFFLLPSRLSRRHLSRILGAFPRAGFHGRLVVLGGAWTVRHPLRPLPMMKL